MQSNKRYSRQIRVKKIGPVGQQRLQGARVLIVGMGGLGCQVGVHLAGAGVGELMLLDHDTVDVSNLHRQILFREKHIGQSKALCAQAELCALNSDIVVNAECERLTPANADSLVEGMDAIVDATDNFATSYLLSDACSKAGISLISASVNSTFGYLGVFCGNDAAPAPSFRAVFPRLPQTQNNCDSVGVTGPAVGIVASFQAQETLKVLLNDEHQLLGELLYLDLWNYSQHKMDMRSAQEPTNAGLNLIETAQITESDFVLDVRSIQEIVERPHPFAVQCEIELPNLGDTLGHLPHDQRIVCVCQSGQRALIAAQILLDNDFASVCALLPSNPTLSQPILN